MTKINGIVLKTINKAMVSIVDQSLFSGMNFVLSLLLGRWLQPVEYGSYSVAMSVFLLVAGVYSAIILEPMSIFGSKGQFSFPGKYSGSILIMHIVITTCITLALLLSTLFPFLGFAESTSAIRVMALTAPLVLTFWLARWSFYTQSQPVRALKVTIPYSIGLLTLIIVIKLLGIVSSETALLSTGFVSILCSFSILWDARKNIIQAAAIEHARLHFGYGKWIVIASILQWISTQFYLVMVSTNLSLSEVAGYRAIQNLAQPFEQISIALSLLLIPWFSRKFANDSTSSLKRIPWVNVILGGMGFLYLGIAWVGRDYLVHTIYQGKYDAYTWLIPYMVGVPLIMSLSKGAQIGARVLEKPSALLIAYLCAGIATVIVGPFLINFYGLIGAAIGRLISALIFSILISFLYHRDAKSVEYDLSVIK